MKRNILIGTGIVSIVALLLLASANIPRRGIITADGSHLAPDFSLHDVQGGSFHLSDLRGKAVVLNFWASWCPPCKAEIPTFVAMQQKYGDAGLQVVGVSLDDGGKDAVVPFAKEIGINYRLLLGTSEVADLYGGVHALPTTFYIGRDGRILRYVPGLIGSREIEENIKEALATTDTQSHPAGPK